MAMEIPITELKSQRETQTRIIVLSKYLLAVLYPVRVDASSLLLKGHYSRRRGNVYDFHRPKQLIEAKQGIKVNIGAQSRSESSYAWTLDGLRLSARQLVR